MISFFANDFEKKIYFQQNIAFKKKDVANWIFLLKRRRLAPNIIEKQIFEFSIFRSANIQLNKYLITLICESD
jgi:hypothetical protein